MTNEWPVPPGQSFGTPKPPIAENTLKTEKVQIERKTFHLTLKENRGGRFLRITEEANGKRASIIVPSSGFEEFREIFADMEAAAQKNPAP